jgi:hypothetical protein
MVLRSDVFSLGLLDLQQPQLFYPAGYPAKSGPASPVKLWVTEPSNLENLARFLVDSAARMRYITVVESSD